MFLFVGSVWIDLAAPSLTEHLPIGSVHASQVLLMGGLALGTSLQPPGLQILSRHYDFAAPEEADVLIALGGDGFLLHVMHAYIEHNLPIYGMNRGTVGFLMNKFSEPDLQERIELANRDIIYPLRMTVRTSEDREEVALAFNEVALIRYSGQSANIRLVVNGITRMEKLICDGILLSTAAGSTAYNFSDGAPIVPLGAQVLALTPVSPFRPRRWRGALLPHDCVVEFVNLDPLKRPLVYRRMALRSPARLQCECRKNDRSRSACSLIQAVHLRIGSLVSNLRIDRSYNSGTYSSYSDSRHVVEY